MSLNRAAHVNSFAFHGLFDSISKENLSLFNLLRNLFLHQINEATILSKACEVLTQLVIARPLYPSESIIDLHFPILKFKDVLLTA
jgi:hypothetical protein